MWVIKNGHWLTGLFIIGTFVQIYLDDTAHAFVTAAGAGILWSIFIDRTETKED